MKHFKIIVLLIFLAPAFLTFTGCDNDSTPPETDDTTNNNTEEILNSFDMGNDRYELITNNALTGSVYNSRDNQTIVTVTGVSKRKSGTNIQDGDVTIQLKFPGNMKGEFEQERLHDVDLEISIKENNKPEIAYATSGDTKLVIDVFEYGASEGDVVKGTFNGKLKSGISSIDVKNGLFEVKREKDI